MSDHKSGGLLNGILIGTALGAIAGVLATPRTGKETRRVLRKSADALPELAEDLATSVQFQADRLSANALGNWEETLERLREAIAAGQVASRQEWQRQAEISQDQEQEQDQDRQHPEGEYSPAPTKVAVAEIATHPSASTQHPKE